MKKSSRVISTLLLGATVASTTTGVFAAETNKVMKEKLAGANRFETAIEVSNEFGKADTVVLVNYMGIADALAATPFAKMKEAPILLTESDKLTESTAKQIEKLGAKNVVVIGGENAVSANVVKELEKSNLTVERLAGNNRYATSAAVAEKMGKVEKVAVVNGVKGLADALSVAAPAAKEGMAIILSNGNEIEAGNEIVDAAKTKYVVGGDKVVSEDLAKEIEAERLAGTNRNATNAAVLNKFYDAKELEKVYVAKDGAVNASQLVDALAAGPLAGKEGNPVMLAGSSLDKAQEAYLKERTAKTLVEVGNGISSNSVDAIVKALEVKDVTPDAKITAVKALNTKSIKVTFDNTVESLDKKDVLVLNNKTSDRLYVKSVTLSEDKKSAQVDLYDELQDKNDYVVEVRQGEASTKAELKFVIGKVAKIEAATKQVVKAGEATAVEYKVYDENGLDITGSKEFKIEFEATVPVTDGKVDLADGKQGFVNVVAMDTKDEDKVLAKSARITVVGETPKAVKVLSYSVEKDQPVFDAKDFQSVNTVQKGTEDHKVFVYAEDQFGKKETAKDAKFESLNKDVAFVDRATGTIKAFKTGTVDVKVTMGDLTKVVPVKVVEDSKLAEVKVDKTDIVTSDKVTKGETIKVSLKDQYGQAIEADKDATVKVLSGEKIVSLGAFSIDGKSEAELVVKPVKDQEGTAKIEIAIDDVKTVINVTVQKAGVLDNYVVEGFEAQLDNNTVNTKTKHEMNLNVFGVDANGVKVGDALETGVTVKVVNEKGDDVPTMVAGNKVSVDNNTKVGKYTTTVKVRTMTIYEGKFEVINTEAKPVIEVKSDRLDAKKGDALLDLVKDAVNVTLDGNKEEITDINEFYSDNNDVIEKGEATVRAEGEATIKVTKVTIDGKEIETDLIFRLKASANAELDAAEKAVADLEAKANALNDSSTNEDVKAARALVQPAKDAVDKLADKTELNSRIDAAELKIKAQEDRIAALEASKKALEDKIAEANTTHDGAVEGTLAGEYAVDSKVTLKKAIETAEKVVANAASTKAEYDAALTELNKAIETFEAGKVS
ncbi:MAG: cell wall-binding repeat-containing protein [Clostridium sp.]